MAVDRAGSGPTVVALHDAGADVFAAPAWDRLAVDHTVLRVVLPGYQGSDRPPTGWQVGDMAAVLADLVERSVGPAVLAGTSLGGWFALEVALRHPAAAAGLVLCAAAGLQCPPDYLFALFADGRAAAGTQRLLEQTLARMVGGDLAALPPAVVRAGTAPWVQDLAAAACSWHPWTAAPATLGRLHAVSCPTAVLWGERDALIPLRHGRLLAAGIPGATLQVVPDAGHLLACERPAVVSAAVRDVVRRAAGVSG